jgi:hypothetical protein
MSWMRLKGLMRKEVYEILRDPSSIAIAFVLPLVLLLIFGYGVSLDARRIAIAEVVDHPSQVTGSFLAELQQSPWFRPTIYANQAAAEQAMMQGHVDPILWLRSDFTRLAYSSGSAPIHLTVNGVDANQARIIENYINGMWLLWLQEEATRQGAHLAAPVAVDSLVWFNPALRSRDYLIPGLIAIIMTTDRRSTDCPGGGAGVGTRDHGGHHGDSGWQGGDSSRQIAPLLRDGHGWSHHVHSNGRVFVWRSAAWIVAGSLRDDGPFPARGAGHGAVDLCGRTQPVHRRHGGHCHHVPAGLHLVRLSVRHSLHATDHPGADPHRRCATMWRVCRASFSPAIFGQL